MTSAASISAIVVNWNGKKWLNKCLDSLSNQTYKHLEIIVIDNGSTDGSIDIIRNQYPTISLIESTNTGFGDACNKAAAEASGDLLAFFNPDTYCEPDFFERLLAFRQSLADQEHIGTIGVAHYTYDKQPESMPVNLGYSLDIFGAPIFNFNKETVFSNSGCPLLIRKNLFLHIGGFCPTIFLYSEDIDLCWRLNIHGFRHYSASNIPLYHFLSGTVGNFSPVKLGYYARGEAICLINNYSLASLLVIYPLFLMYQGLHIIYFICTRKIQFAMSIIKAHCAIWKDREKIWSFRKRVQSSRSVSDYVILNQLSLLPHRLRKIKLFT